MPPGEGRLVGLALSGGGIRSASFALGVLQALDRYGHLKKFDYLSTVSGGGYIGSALTWSFYRYRKGRASGDTQVPEPDPSFPFGHRGQVLRATAEKPGEGQARKLPEDDVAFMRQHGSYLVPTRHLAVASLVGTVLRNVVATFSVYFALLVAVMLALRAWPEALASLARASQTFLSGLVPATLVPATATAGLLALCSVLFSLVTALFTKVRLSEAWQYSLRVRVQQALGWLVSATVGLLAIGMLPLLAGTLTSLWSRVTFSAAALASLAGVVWTFAAQVRPRLAILWPKINGAAVWVGGAALVYAVLLGGYLAADWLVTTQPERVGMLGLAFGAYGLLVGFFVNTNMAGIHRMYRDRLMEAFLPDPTAVGRRQWQPAHGADRGYLKDMCVDEDAGPFHVINTHVILSASSYAYFRGRGGDNFIFSPLYCGSEATRWIPTSQYCNGKMTLATAMAISGAAVNPNTGVAGRGPTRNRLASFMLALFNIRLGYWVPNPNARPPLKAIVRHLWPNLLFPGLRQGLLGQGHHTRTGYLEVTDGGHFDNTGLYELIRRKLGVIVLSLASADPKYQFDDLADVIERVRVDFGAFIHIPDCLQNAVPTDPCTSSPGLGGGLKTGRSGYSVGEIEYHDGSKGTLIVLKSVLRPDVPIDVLQYAMSNAVFPNQATADQFFDERQFEAYREVGYAVCRKMLDGNAVQNWF
jgi:hypothetical protein